MFRDESSDADAGASELVSFYYLRTMKRENEERYKKKSYECNRMTEREREKEKKERKKERGYGVKVVILR